MDAPASMVPPAMEARLVTELAHLPEGMRVGLLDYLRYGLPPGSFLQALLSNDLAEACARADRANQGLIWCYVFVLYNYAPSQAWGSPEKVRAWIRLGQERRRQAAEQEG